VDSEVEECHGSAVCGALAAEVRSPWLTSYQQWQNIFTLFTFH